MRIQYYIRPRNTTEESAFVEELIQTIAERQRHGRRGRVGGRFPVASRSRAGGPAAVPEGGTQVFALRAQVPFCLRIESGQIKQRCCPHFAKAPTIRRE